MGRLDGKVAIVTGGSRGIGRAVALAFAAEGADVAITGAQDQEALDNVKAEIEALERRAIASIADVSHRAEIDNFIAAVADRWGRTDILVNNAGVIRMTPLEDISEEQWDRTIAVHLKGTFNCTQAVIPIMKRGSGGKIINVAAPSALRGSSGVSDYAAAKGGIIAFTLNAANELAPYNIQVNCISPVARTRMTDELIAYRQRHANEPSGSLTRGGTIEPEATTPPFVFFASSESDLITGQTLALHRR
ncbi:MAG: SDR family NAD(P)-dependent oxidoreductase [Rhodospirillaceae bacterium]|jgi:3-oxoacyl-[acyl-carrier protein] reductase|nr:SDR family NAD(P)-dependent oxidoreductase [Rhodospirillaceae bacterium]MBT5458279.1 SDR family NAD(P)-dependent oxidoreductase [Rhodospirillaceae bacterium]